MGGSVLLCRVQLRALAKVGCCENIYQMTNLVDFECTKLV